jgi:lipopolysaccharide/colanic/teichoic acid biosynthesis glycosyltransferase
MSPLIGTNAATRNEGTFGAYHLVEPKRDIDLIAVADWILALLLMILALPVLAVAVIWVTASDFGNPFLIQPRVGKGGHTFRCFKVRTMKQTKCQTCPAYCAIEDPRIILGGHFLRRLRIDEIPQFLNVLLGDMALVGPRPELEAFVVDYRRTIHKYDLRHSHKPGITGLAQVRLGYVDGARGTRMKLVYDLFYIERRSFKLWAFVVANTVITVLKRTGR